MMIVALVLLVAGGVIWFVARREEQIEVRGNLSAKDLAEIKSAVKSELRQEILPDFSWSSIKSMPTATSRYFQNRIRVVAVLDNTNSVIVGFGNPQRLSDSFELMRGTNGWSVNLNGWRLIPQVY